MSEPKLSKAYSRYGASMGRRDVTDCDSEASVSLRCYRVRLDSGGYDNGGAYWGARSNGRSLWRCFGEHDSGSVELFVDATSRLEAIAIARESYPKARFQGASNASSAALERFISAYITAALWSSTDNADPSGGEPLDRNYSEANITRKSLAKMRADCTAFYTANSHLWASLPNYCHPQSESTSADMAGHDFWLTRNGHGCGFWDRGLGAIGETLSAAARAFGESYLTVYRKRIYCD